MEIIAVPNRFGNLLKILDLQTLNKDYGQWPTKQNRIVEDTQAVRRLASPPMIQLSGPRHKARQAK
jgi:hypothetical protein